ncbi:MAG: enolase C-terminal domain-like protein [Propionibacteriaceae bacterium]
MRPSDVTVLEATVEPTEIRLQHPFEISGRVIDWFTLAEVTVRVRTRDGREATGTGATILSVPWAWPVSSLDVAARDAILRKLTNHWASTVVGLEPADPIRLWRTLYAELEEESSRVAGEVEVPRLAMLLALGATDSAVHDAWAKAAQRPAHLLYDADHLDADLSFLGPQLQGQHPGDHLRPPASEVAIQHLVGAGDPLLPADAAAGERSLLEWLQRDRPRHLKVKTSALDPAADARRVADVAQVAATAGIRVALSVDPNEGYHTAAELARFLDAVEEQSLPVAFVEQPYPRDETPPGLSALSRRLPILQDEGFTRISSMPALAEQGWSGMVIKAGKGHTPALLAHSYARVAGLAVTVQDLTAVGSAFAHSARLVSIFNLAAAHLEYNSRQYAPEGNDGLAVTFPDLVRVRDGLVNVPNPAPGLY